MLRKKGIKQLLEKRCQQLLFYKLTKLFEPFDSEIELNCSFLPYDIQSENFFLTFKSKMSRKEITDVRKSNLKIMALVDKLFQNLLTRYPCICA